MLILLACGGGGGTAPDPPQPVASVEIVPDSLTLQILESVKLAVRLRDAEGRILPERDLDWSTSDAAVAAIGSSGTVTGMSAGPAMVSASVGGVSGSAAVSVTARAIGDRPDDLQGSQIHVFYALPAGGADRRLDLNQTIVNTFGSVQTHLAGQTGGRRLRVDTSGGELDITFLPLSRTEAEINAGGSQASEPIFDELEAAGFTGAGKINVVYYDGSEARQDHCYEALRVGGQVLVVGFLESCSGEFADAPTDPPGILEIHMLHDLLHGMGFVGEGAPNEEVGHVNDDPRDLLHLSAPTLESLLLDVGHDDYFGENVPAGVMNLADSPFLTP